MAKKKKVIHLSRLTQNDIDNQFIRIPKEYLIDMPKKEGKIRLKVEDNNIDAQYNREQKRLYIPRTFFNDYQLEEGDKVDLVKRNSSYSINIKQGAQLLLSTIKGNIAEDRIKDIILIDSKGRLNVYKPVTDVEGIDLIVLDKKMGFKPLFIQVKGRYTKQRVWDVKAANFKANKNYLIICVDFNGRDIGENLLLIPSELLVRKKEEILINDGDYFQIQSSLDDGSKGKWVKQRIETRELVTELLKILRKKTGH